MKSFTTISLYNNHSAAEQSVVALQNAGCDMQKVSIIGRDSHDGRYVAGYYNTGDRNRYWGKLGVFWGDMWGWLSGSACWSIPGIGSVVIAGPLVVWMVSALEGPALTGGMSALGAALRSVGVPKDSILNYEASLKANAFLIVVHGENGEVQQAGEILKTTQHNETVVHEGKGF